MDIEIDRGVDQEGVRHDVELADAVHRAKIVQEFVDSTNGELELHFLPPYSPQLNPDEQVWKHVKERVTKQFPKDKFELRIMLRKALQHLQNSPAIVRAFFAHPYCCFVN